MKQTSEAAFETAIEAALLTDGYVSLPSTAFDRERAIFPETVLEFIRGTQPREWGKLEALHVPRYQQLDAVRRMVATAAQEDVVQKIDEDSRQLAEVLEVGVPMIDNPVLPVRLRAADEACRGTGRNSVRSSSTRSTAPSPVGTAGGAGSIC